MTREHGPDPYGWTAPDPDERVPLEQHARVIEELAEAMAEVKRLRGVDEFDHHAELTPNQAAAETHARLAPYERSFEGKAPDGEWANSVLVTTVAVYDPTERPEQEAEWAADNGDRQLVRVDTNYKATRPGEHPVDLSRTDAARLAAAVLEATEDTFHHGRLGELRAAEAAQLLSALEDVDYALANLRSHALGDLCKRIEVDPDGR